MGKKRRLRIVTEDLARIGDPNAVVVVDPDEADELGAFEETALSVEDAWESDEPEPRPASSVPAEDVPAEVQFFIDRFFASLDDSGTDDEDEDTFVTSLEGLEAVPVYPSTDELTGEAITGWGLRERDLRSDDLTNAVTGEKISRTGELDLATQILINPDWAEDHGLPRTQEEWQRAHEEWLKNAEEYVPEED